MKKKKPNKILDFFAEKGFYIILILCIAAIGISGYVLFFSSNYDGDYDVKLGDNGTGSIIGADLSPAPTPYEVELQTEIPDYAVRDTEVVMAEPDDDSTDNEDAALSAPDDEDEQSESVMAEVSGIVEKPKSGEGLTSSISTTDYETTPVAASFFVWPVNGEVIERFSVDELVFSETLVDWRVHPGADIAAALGTQVHAMGDGVVEDIYTDELMGVTVVIDHGNSVRSVYRNLMESVIVNIGDIVYAGDVIGGVGKTADNELLDPPHLHLEVIKNGAQVDPLSLLP
jgi:murein DD-endopeptidase MepM/ murein hydrolase activator NlpD